MSSFEVTQTVGEIVARHPGLSRVFEKYGIDYCCGGKRSIEDACGRKGLNPEQLVAQLAETDRRQEGQGDEPVPAEMSLSELADHIEQTHHAWLREELPRLDQLTNKVSKVHGDRDPRLRELRDTYLGLAEELFSHMMKEERILFPMIRQLEASSTTPQFHCGSLGNPIGQMEHEHDSAASGLDRLRSLTDGYQPPDWACNTYRAMIAGLSDLERDLHLHIHKENNVLFPRAEQEEARKQRS